MKSLIKSGGGGAAHIRRNLLHLCAETLRGGLAEALKQRGRVDHIGHVGYHRQIHAGAAQRLPLAGAFGSGGGGVGAVAHVDADEHDT
ncbi:MAG TPA: hypothetical protein PL031_08395, partial [Neisseria sp.]|nr:hypothetical protein [Neisseria sp.]